MSYKLVEGEVRLFYQSTRLVGSRPDGDSVWFKPDNPDLLSNIGGRAADFNKGGFAQLRFEGIDALELHYPGDAHQLLGPALAARDFLLAALGFDLDKIEYAPTDGVPTAISDSAPVKVRASIMTRAIDRYGRPVVFVFAGNAPERSGSQVFLDARRLDQSLNSALLRTGQAYPAFYTARQLYGRRVGGLPGDLRKYLTLLAVSAGMTGRGVWQHDASAREVRVTSRDDLTNLAIWPKLYRRLVKYFDDQNADHSDLRGFIDWLRDDRSERDDFVIVLPIGELLNLSDILTVTETTIRLDYAPSELVVIPQ
jgi:endonuclease YncB( thermonuclease family)